MSTRRVVRWDTVNHTSGPICWVGTLDDGEVFVALDLPHDEETGKPLTDLEEDVIEAYGQSWRVPRGGANPVEVGQRHQDESTPDGLTVSADGSLLNWNGVNYVPQVPGPLMAEAQWLERAHANSADKGYGEEYRKGFAAAATWVRFHAEHGPFPHQAEDLHGPRSPHVGEDVPDDTHEAYPTVGDLGLDEQGLTAQQRREVEQMTRDREQMQRLHERGKRIP